MTTKHQTRRRSMLALVLGGGALLALIAALAVAVGRPAPPIDVDRSTPTGSTALARPDDQKWGHDVLRSHDPARPKAKPVVGPGLPATTVLATQQPFVAAPATASPPKVPDAYRGAIPPPAKRTSGSAR